MTYYVERTWHSWLNLILAPACDIGTIILVLKMTTARLNN